MRHHCSFAILLLVLTVSGINGQNLAKDPASSKEYFFRGLARQSAGDINGAIADFSKSIGLDEGVLATYDSEKVKAGLAEAYCQRGQARMKQEHGVDGALADFNRAIVLNPRSINAYGQRALALHLKNSASQSNSQVVTNDLQKSRSAESPSQSSETTSPEVRTTLGRDSSLVADSKIYIAPSLDGFENDLKKSIKKKELPLVIVADRTSADFEIRIGYSGGAVHKTICAVGYGIATIPYRCQKTENSFGHLSVVNIRTGSHVFVENVEVEGDAETCVADRLVEGLMKKIRFHVE